MNPEVLTPEYIFTFGRNRGRRLSDVDVGYIAWCRKEIDWFRRAYDRMVSGEGIPRADDTTIRGTTADMIIMDDVTDRTPRATDGGGDLGDSRPRRYRGGSETVEVKSEPEPDISWLNRMGINYDRDRGRV